MEFKTRHIGAYGGFPATIIELKVSINGAEITEFVTDNDGVVDKNFIMALRELADELEEHNKNKAENK